jgi:hypothetical protein
MKKAVFIALIFSVQVSAQRNLFSPADSLHSKRVSAISITLGSAWSGSMIGLHEVWYKNQEKSKFHTFNDGNNWLQMDKLGHVYTNYSISRLSGDLYKWSGMNNRKAAILGAGIGFGFQTTLEIFDAYNVDWGFSWYDVTSNALGAGLYLGQELAWEEQRILLKFSYHPTEYAAIRPAVLGANFQERLLKDYNGQTYWLSFNPFLFSSDSKFPKWLCFSFGYSADAKLVGNKEIYTHSIGNEHVTYISSRQFLASLDIDFSRIPAKKPWLKAVLKQLNYVKIPFPALLFQNGKLQGKALYF